MEGDDISEKEAKHGEVKKVEGDGGGIKKERNRMGR